MTDLLGDPVARYAGESLYSGRGAVVYDDLVRRDSAELREFIGLVRGKRWRVLEIAAGSGRVTLPLVPFVAELVAVDISTDLLDLLDERARTELDDDLAQRLTLVAADVRQGVPEHASGFDAVVIPTASITLFDAAERAALLTRLLTRLRPGGTIALTVRTPHLAGERREIEVDEGLRIVEESDEATGRHRSTVFERGGAGRWAAYSVDSFVLPPALAVAELERAGFEAIERRRIRRDAAGEYEFLTARVAELRSPYIEFFTPSSAWGRLEAVRATGVRVEFADGSEALCATSGLWNANLGYGNPAVAAAIDGANREASTLPLFRRGSSYARLAAERLLDFTGRDRFDAVLYSTSGSSALDAAIKLSRHLHQVGGDPARKRILSFRGSYHGMTMSAMSLTGAAIGQGPYAVDERWSVRIDHDDLDALAVVLDRFGTSIAAVILEPVLGSGALPVPAAMIDALGVAADVHGFLVVADEVATGFHRTGPRFASDEWHRAPDLLVTSKALTNGTSAAAAILLARGPADVLRSDENWFWHGETQAGSPQSCAAIIATIDEFERQDVAASAARVARRLGRYLDGVAARSTRAESVGVGSFRALHLVGRDGTPLGGAEVTELVELYRSYGVLVQPGPCAVQFVPALTYSDTDLDELERRSDLAIDEFLA
ncbi:aminotransferase class III-fold pyridoxal phosphate-dependent enzyme [Agromyces atrinae]|uniref:Adenosylmethionine-8-amino-7-oxononanoate aminotransferase/SAM-dependent methyltransferase n=1 Tax=Agromyces atrinae TaxID=592376 RepID=A0A4Q2M088_9MICO|nr:aminotransferase class III-fold pyridoxal phosphate-dependent enzyme [Agromyces atrinae]NYD67011.1 adenosylmethionine-8-amino-7-oxononanoate aminotransferase/SAM-dependent methyltransferase [Agromyces atrinae]RXZ85255.1 aminotransferase class III-fold pyridoxal phosphate-dependent enzyme [Agromyces atrinae]RXZ85363.1 aminotransferase class III-fold pyridoxal phosphate-dependent enzyme [Agromyces atrinae]